MTAASKAIRVLLVDDDATFRDIMSAELARRGYGVVSAPTGKSALERHSSGEIDVILLDLRLPDMDGIEVLKKLSLQEGASRVVILTGHGTIDTAIQAIRLGAYDYLEKPCPVEQVEIAVHKAHENLRLVERQKVLEDGFAPPDVRHQFIGSSPAFEKLRQTIAKIAAADSTTLLLGETGVGKEMVATLLHEQSPRKDRPFIAIDCASLHENLLLSELFGHEKGSFTGAARRKHGLFEVATGGTIFLDEIGETSSEVQVKLLRVLETGRFRRLGGNREIAVDVRVISATNRDLRDEVSRGRFREDLFFRLSTLTVNVPPLRERREDIPLLVEHYARQFNARFSMAKTFGPSAMDVLLRHPWPGNIRELIHAVEQAMVLAEKDTIEAQDLPSSILPAGGIRKPEAAEAEMLPLREVQRRHVLAVLEKVGGNRAQAARILEISERNLYRLLPRYAPRSLSPGEEP